MSKLSTAYSYEDYETVTVLGRRFYDLGAVAYPGITTVLGHTPTEETKTWLSGWKARVGETKAEQVRNAAALRGTHAHLMLERYLRGEDIQAADFPPDHVKLFNSMKLELANINTAYGQEVALYSHALGVAGRCDLIAEHQGELAIVDYKTSTRVKSREDIGDYWIQTAFYALAHNEMFGTNISKLVIIMGVENKLPMVFKSRVSDDLIVKLAERTAQFYDQLEQETA